MLTRSFILLCLAVALAAAQSSEALIQQYSREGEQALAAGRYGEAAEAYEKLKALAPGVAEIHARLGLVYFQQGRFEKAAPPLRQALKLKPSLPNTDILLAMTLSELGQYNEALAGLQKGFKRTADAALRRSSGLQLQRVYTGLGQDDKAVEVALEMTRAFPKDPEVLYHAGKLFGNFAYLSTVKLAEVGPGSLWLRLAAGEANESQGRIDVALTEYRQAAALNPKYPGLHFRMGRALLARARQNTEDQTSEPEALREFETELQIDPTNANAAYEAAEIYRKNAQFEKARELFAQAIAHYPNFEEAQVGLGRALLALGKADLALSPLQKALSLNSQNEVAHYQVAQVYRALGRPEDQKKALAEYERLQSMKTNRSSPLSRQEATKQQIDLKSPQ